MMGKKSMEKATGLTQEQRIERAKRRGKTTLNREPTRSEVDAYTRALIHMVKRMRPESEASPSKVSLRGHRLVSDITE
jgi:hypothetical protein